jgi:hypothetical protein
VCVHRSCNQPIKVNFVYGRFGYLWAVHSLYYWWRDQGLAEHGSLQSEHSPCYLNRMDPTEVAVGWGKYTLEVLRAFINRYGAHVLQLLGTFEGRAWVSHDLRVRRRTCASRSAQSCSC